MSWRWSRRRDRDAFSQLMRWRRNVFVTLPDGRHALICATKHEIVLHVGCWRAGEFQSQQTYRGQPDRDVWDGRGWNLRELQTFIDTTAGQPLEQLPGEKEKILMTDDLNDYRAFGTFCAVYTDAKRYLMAQDAIAGRQVFHVLDALAQHANPLGLCYPGYKRLAEISHYAVSTVEHSMETLFELDWVRLLYLEAPDINEQLKRWIISPYVLWIARDHIERALELWNQATVIFSVTKESQPTPESRVPTSYPTSYPTNSPTTPPTTTTTTNSAQRAQKTVWREAHESIENDGKDIEPDNSAQRAQSAQSAAQREAQKKTPPGSAPPPPVGGSLAQFRQPLPDKDAENLSHLLQAKLHTRLTQARQLVANYSVQEVETALAWLDDSLKQGTKVRSSVFGMVKWWLEHNAIADGDKPRGKYDDWVER